MDTRDPARRDAIPPISPYNSSLGVREAKMKLMGSILGGAPKVGASAALWTFPSIVFSSFMIAWAAESAQFFISQGLSLAILAWVQTIPEFAVEAVIAWNAPKMHNGVALVSANFTGSLRLLTGLGWPMIYGVAAFFHRRRYGRPLKQIRLEPEHSVEVMALLPPILYFVAIVIKSSLSIWDAAALFVMYIAYLFILRKIPPKEHEDATEEEWPIRQIVRMAPAKRNATIAGLFITGAAAIYFTADPFLHSLLALASTLGVSSYIFVQWVAPFLSEFPEKLSAFYWARKVTHAPMALMNMVSSNINQWTMLAGMIPIVYSLSLGSVTAVPFDDVQQMEILLTVAQSGLAFCLLANMAFAWWEAALLFVLWLVQFIFPTTHLYVASLYGVWIGAILIGWLADVQRARAFAEFSRLFKGKVLGG
jgi:cation:H+ antiporter